MANSERTDRIRQAVAEYVGKVADGQDVSPEAWAKAHPDLLPELAAELKKVQRIGAACQRALDGVLDGASPAVDRSELSTRGYSSYDGGALHVRCPHCHNPVDIVGDASLTDIVCTSCGSSFSLLRDTYATPTVKTIAHFELVERLGMGSFGTVWKARDAQLDRTVAIKIPREGRLATPELEHSFFREARAAAQLKHPGIVSVHEVGRQEDIIYIVSDLVRGASLSEWLSSEKPTARESAELCAKIADALHHAHQKGVVHRDLKPSNIMIDLEGAPHIMDFGLARRDAGEVTVTVDGQMLGTPSYMSPEQARGEAHQADRRSDVYSLGVILFQLLTGELPFRGRTRMILMQILRDEPPKPRTLKAGIPRDLQTICLKCLEKEPAKRYATAQDLADDLRRYMRGEPILARPIGRMARTWRWCKRNPRVAGLTAAVASLLVTIGIAASLLAWRERIRRETEVAQENARREAAVAQERDTYRQLYFSDMHGAVDALADGNVERVRDLLDRHLPQPGREDLRGFEWYYLWQQCRRVLSLRTFQYGGPLTSVAISPDGTTLAAGGGATTNYDNATYNCVKTWSLATGKHVDTFPTNGWARAITFSPDSKALACRDDSGEILWDLANSAQRFISPNQTVNNSALTLSPDGRILATVAGDHRVIWLWDTTTHRMTREIDVGKVPSYRLSFSADGNVLASVDSHGNITLFDSSTGEVRSELRNHCGYAVPVYFGPDDKTLISGGPGGTILVWDLESRVPPQILSGHSRNLLSLTMSHDGALLASASYDGTIKLWDMLRFEQKDTMFGITRKLGAAALSSDGRTLAAGSTNGTVTHWDLSALPPPEMFKEHKSEVWCSAVSPKGDRAASGEDDGTVRIWDVSSGKELFKLESHKGGAWSVAFDPSGQVLATSGADDKIRLWDSSSEMMKRELEGHEGSVNALTFAGGTQLVSVGSDPLVRIWNWQSKEKPRMFLPTSNIGPVAVSPDSRLVVTAGFPAGHVDVRDLQTLNVIHTLRGTSAASFLTFRIVPLG